MRISDWSSDVCSSDLPAGATVKDVLTGHIVTIGENMNVRRAAVLAVDPGVVVSYVHNAAGEGLGKIGVLVAVQSSAPADQLAALGKQLAMHVAAANPLALDEGGIDPEVVERERAIAGSAGRRGGKGWGRTCRSRWSAS